MRRVNMLLASPPTLIRRQPLYASTARPRRRRTLTAMLAEEEPNEWSHNAAAPVVASPSPAPHTNAFLVPSPFGETLQHAATTSSSSSRHAHPATRNEGNESTFQSSTTLKDRRAFASPSLEDDEASAQKDFLDRQRRRRDLFAHQPKVLLRKSVAQYRKEVQQVQKEALLRAGNEVGVTGAAPQLSSSSRARLLAHAKKQVAKDVAVPLFPPLYLQQQKFTTAACRADPEEQGAQQLQLAITRNHLAQVSERQPFRCLRCFHVFEGKPSTLLEEKVHNSAVELRRAQDHKNRLMTIAKRPSLRKKVHSAMRQRREWEKDPTCCPQCRSEKVQWLMEYAHHRTHLR